MRKLNHEEIPRLDPETLRSLPKHPICVLVHNVRSIYNVGSIFRTSDAALIERIYLSGISGTPENRGLHKTALGAQDTVSWEYVPDPVALVDELKREGYTIAALEITDEPTATVDIDRDAFPLCLIVGNEFEGVDDALLRCADLAMEIPQFGAKQSLNVAVAYGIAIFDIVRRYRAFSGLPSDLTNRVAVDER